MITMLAGLGTAALLWWVLKLFAKASPARIAQLVRQVGGVVALLAAGLLMFRGRFDMAFLVGSGGAWLLGWNGLPAPFGGRASIRKSPGSVSRVRSATIEMELEHDTGRVGGHVLAGLFEGRALASLSEAELLRLRAECLVGDPDGGRLVETYLDSRHPAWREHAQADPDPRRGPEPERGAMTEQEAYQVLGLQPGAGPDAIRQAHRTLMKKLHPDGGGSTYLASRVNGAKDVLLNRHR